MIDRDKVIRYYRASGDEILAAKLLDNAEVAEKSRKYKVTEFLDPYGLSMAETVKAHSQGLLLSTSGGYAQAERVKAVFLTEGYSSEVDFDIAALQFEWDERYAELSHRDVLGGLLGMGIKREVVGDILMLRNGCQVILDAAMAKLVLAECSRLGAASVNVKAITLDAIVGREEKTKEIRATVASLRLDSVAAAGFGMSRSKMAEEIEAERLKVNWKETRSTSHAVKVGDILSMRGRGRVEVAEITGQTKKGRVGLLLKRFY